MSTANTDLKVINTEFFNSNQSWNYDRIVKVDDDLKLRVQIRRNAYDKQSSATVSAWTTEKGWAIVASRPITECQCAAASYVMTATQELFDADADALINVALGVLR